MFCVQDRSGTGFAVLGPPRLLDFVRDSLHKCMDLCVYITSRHIHLVQREIALPGVFQPRLPFPVDLIACMNHTLLDFGILCIPDQFNSRVQIVVLFPVCVVASLAFGPVMGLEYAGARSQWRFKLLRSLTSQGAYLALDTPYGWVIEIVKQWARLTSKGCRDGFPYIFAVVPCVTPGRGCCS